MKAIRKRFQRFCPHGHDLMAPHGSYIKTKDGYTYPVCGVCERERTKRYSQRRRDREKTV